MADTLNDCLHEQRCDVLELGGDEHASDADDVKLVKTERHRRL